jgi:hypothetical protein
MATSYDWFKIRGSAGRLSRMSAIPVTVLLIFSPTGSWSRDYLRVATHLAAQSLSGVAIAATASRQLIMRRLYGCTSSNRTMCGVSPSV